MNFFYKARSNEGSEVQGVIDAPNEKAVTQILTEKGLWVTNVSLSSSSFNLHSDVRVLTWIPAATFNGFLIQLAMLIRSGVPLAEALASLETGETQQTFKKILGEVLREVEQGRSFSVALSTHPEVFDPFFIGMIRVAEAGGVLDKVLDKLAKINQRSISMRNQLFGALTYPALLLTVASFVLLILFGYALPRFAGMFITARVALPLPTKILLTISEFASNNLRVLLFLLVGTVVVGLLAIVTRTGRWIGGEIALRIPISGKIVQCYLVVHIAEMLGLLLGAGVPLMELLTAIENTLTMPTARRLLETMRHYVERGSTLRLSLEGNLIFPPMALKLIETGEKTGNLDAMFEEIAGFYDDQLQTAIKAAFSLLEPAMIIFIAGIVGFVVLSVAMPIFQMSALIGGS
jgi:type IV pilus assembly protein PilC